MSGLATTPALSPSQGAPDQNLVRIRDLVYQIAGIFQPDNKLRMMEDRIAKRMKALGVSSLRDYYDCLTVKPIRQAELVSLLNEVTIGETCFFRNQPQLDGIRNIVLPKIVKARENLPLRHLRIWSAGCSTGEEPYTLSMLMLEEIADRLKGWTFEILATDLNERSLAHAQHGAYGSYSTRNLTAYYRSKYFVVRNENLQVNTEVKNYVKFSRVNLSDNARMAFLKGIDIVLCCNVLIYFDASSKRRVIQHFYNSLLPQWLFAFGALGIFVRHQ